MTTEETTVWQLRCDSCQELLEDADYGSHLVAESVDRIREIAADQEWSRDGDDDLCPACACARLGHVRHVSASGAWCSRCNAPLFDTVKPKAAYL